MVKGALEGGAVMILYLIMLNCGNKWLWAVTAFVRPTYYKLLLRGELSRSKLDLGLALNRAWPRAVELRRSRAFSVEREVT